MRQVTESSESGTTIADLLNRLRAAGFECESNVSSNLSIRGVSQDSRDIRPGDLFLALPGTTTDGARFIADAFAAGAVAALCSRDVADVAADGYAYIVVDDVVRAAGHAAAMALGDPADRMRLIGVTGTNGKTSCTYLLDHVLCAAGQNVGVLGTISQRWAGRERKASMTTPPTVELHRAFASMAAADCRWVAMEVSSHALSQHRVAGCRFDAAIFTNLTRDHLDYHGDEESYFAAKASLFLDYLDPSSGIAVLNAEDSFAMRLSGMLGAERCRTFTTRADSECDVSVIRAETGLDGIRAELRIGNRSVEINSRLIGLPNLANIAAVTAAASAVGIPDEAIVAGINGSPPVPGRLERVGDQRPVVLVDFAHTPDALERTLEAIRANNAGGRLIAVFGCGGDRDRGKRPMMGEIAGRLADISIITSDNPRSEDPSTIVADIEAGILPNATRVEADEARRTSAGGGRRRYMIEVDRERAITAALGVAGPEDFVVVAGKGHEDYQDIAGVRHHFDDREVVQRLVESPLTKRPKANAVMNAQMLAAAARGALIGDSPLDWTLGDLTTDSRAAGPESVFVALVGDNYDGNDFIDDALSRGARVVVCSRGRALDRRGVAFIEVDDTLRALGDIAAAHRRCFQIPVVAITGSNGKTTTKELLRSILAYHHGEDAVLATAGNFNNLVGLPLTAMRMTAEHRVAVLEMGMNAPGEIARLTEIAGPTHALITCVASAHLEGLGSIEGIARAKGELFAGLDESATAIVNLHDHRVAELGRTLHTGPRLGYGRDGRVHVGEIHEVGLERARFELVFEPAPEDSDRSSDHRPVTLALGGRHNVHNATAAAACALALGLDPDTISAGLEAAEPPPMRLSVEALGNGVAVVNDAYSANSHSLAAALATLSDGAPGRSIVVLGEMLELGPQAADLHRQAGRDTARIEPVLVCALGAHARQITEGALEAGLPEDRLFAVDAGGHARIAAAVAGVWKAGDSVLVKGSRGACMELVMEEMKRLAES